MKKEYRSVELEVIRLEAEDVITTSGADQNVTVADKEQYVK